MVRSLAISLLFITILSAYGMDKDAVPQPNPRRKKFLAMYLKHGAFYAGEGIARGKAEELYGQKFPLNTIFFEIGFHNKDPHTIFDRVPEIIPYDWIQDKYENSCFGVRVDGKKYTFCCKQWPEDKISFEDFVFKHYDQFAGRAHWAIESVFSEQEVASLEEAHVIDLNTKSRHGESCSPYLFSK